MNRKRCRAMLAAALGGLALTAWGCQSSDFGGSYPAPPEAAGMSAPDDTPPPTPPTQDDSASSAQP